MTPIRPEELILDPYSPYSPAQKTSDGADSQPIRRRLIRDIVSAARQIPYQVVRIRLPRYPGVSCGQSGAVGLHVGIKGRFYDSPDEAQKTFQTMKYFYLGQRTEGDPGGKAEGKL